MWVSGRVCRIVVFCSAEWVVHPPRNGSSPLSPGHHNDYDLPCLLVRCPACMLAYLVDRTVSLVACPIWHCRALPARQSVSYLPAVLLLLPDCSCSALPACPSVPCSCGFALHCFRVGCSLTWWRSPPPSAGAARHGLRAQGCTLSTRCTLYTLICVVARQARSVHMYETVRICVIGGLGGIRDGLVGFTSHRVT